MLLVHVIDLQAAVFAEKAHGLGVQQEPVSLSLDDRVVLSRLVQSQADGRPTSSEALYKDPDGITRCLRGEVVVAEGLLGTGRDLDQT